MHDGEARVPELAAEIAADRVHGAAWLSVRALRGLEATHELARLAGVAAGMKVLDLGGGIGGPARVLASAYGADVTVLDLTPEFCRTGEALTRRVGLDDRIRFRVGDAVQQPFEAGAFDLVWTQHSTMNIPDKPRLYRECARVLKPGGTFTGTDWFKKVHTSPAEEEEFIEPICRLHGLPSLITLADLREQMEAAGLPRLSLFYL